MLYRCAPRGAPTAGYIHADSGKRYVLVAIVNHSHANAARPAIDVLIDWTIQDK